MGRTKLAHQAASLAMTGKAVSESESENRRIRVSKAQENEALKGPPNCSINRTRIPPFHYPCGHCGPVISVVRQQKNEYQPFITVLGEKNRPLRRYYDASDFQSDPFLNAIVVHTSSSKREMATHSNL